MSLTAQVQAGVSARVQTTSGLTQVIENNTLEFTVSVGT